MSAPTKPVALVFREDGSLYFTTQDMPRTPAEEDHWIGMGYRVEWWEPKAEARADAPGGT